MVLRKAGMAAKAAANGHRFGRARRRAAPEGARALCSRGLGLRRCDEDGRNWALADQF